MEKLVDGLTVNAAGESVIVDNEAYLEAVRRNLPESLQRAYEQAVDTYQQQYDGVLEPKAFQSIYRLIPILGETEEYAPRVNGHPILPVSMLYMSASHAQFSMEEVDAVIDGMVTERLLSLTRSLTTTYIPFDTGIAIAIHPALLR
ncbi:MAG TPA: hypothetical protein VM512_17155 [Burkholderiaceae bacterium]|nr:hypothetical protein [Burkholderiaceae bacterium]